MTIIATPSTSASSIPSSSRQTLDDKSTDVNPLREKRQQLQQTQVRLSQIEHVKGQLQHLLTKPKQSQRRLSGSGKSSWSMQSDVSTSSLAGEIQDGQLLVPLSRSAFVPATIKGFLADDEAEDVVIYMRQDDVPKIAQVESLFIFDGNAEPPPPGYNKMTVSQALNFTNQLGIGVEQQLSILKDEVVHLARETLAEHLSERSGRYQSLSSGPVNDQGQAINEEGLPFVDPIEPLMEDEKKSAVPTLPRFDREDMSKDDRKMYINSILDELQAEERKTPLNDFDDEDLPRASARQDTRPGIHRRVSSADRPPPSKSVLKNTGPVPPPIPRFGSSGVRRGFLNLNPSSPAAERSSDPIQSYNFNQTQHETMLTRSNSTNADSIASDDSSKEERMSRSVELPSSNSKSQQRKKKKTVRIQSPVRELKLPVSNELLEKKDEDIKDVEEEAKSILELLGLEAIKDHPQAGGLYEAIKDGEKMRQLAEKAESARQSAIKTSTDISPPAVGQIVSERVIPSSKTDKNASGFKKGFLNGKPPDRVPIAPQKSLGMSALDRATQSDKVLEEEREKQGLKPAVPHARPSKAFAARLEAKRRGDTVADEGEEDDGEDQDGMRKSRVRFGESNNGEVRVHVGTAASSATGTVASQSEDSSELHDEDDSLDTIGMDICEEDLDEGTVEALGYFSDEEYDPDIGWDEEDLQLSRPNFSAEVESISNEELRKEYERMKASLNQQQLQGDAKDHSHDEGEEEQFIEGADLSMQDDENDLSRPKISRFRQDRAKRKLQGQVVKSKELGTGLGQATNLGPSMLIPSIANVRYPKSGQMMMEGREVELDGDSDEENVEEIMRQRLSQRQQGEGKMMLQSSSRPSAPPEILSSQQSDDLSKISTAKKPSLFKSRMNQN